MPSGSGSVNYLVNHIPKDSADSYPPTMSVILDETRNDMVASGRYPNTLPALIVTVNDNTKLNAETYSDVRDADVSLVIRYIQFDNANSNGTQNCLYTLRAVQQCLGTWMKSDNVSQRVRNNIQVIECLSIEHVPIWPTIEDVACVGALRYTFRVRDISPTV
jgi:hypothetical protein